jgi:polar amino acid transport system substrate-binding protein
MQRVIVGFLVSLAVALGLPAAALGAGEAGSPGLSRIVKSGVLRVGMSGGQPPLNVRSKQGQIIGLEPDLAQILAATMGVEVKLVAKPFSQLLPALEAGEVDLVMSGLTITPERNLRFAFVGPYFVSGKAILTNSKALAKADEASDIDDPGIKLAALEGSTSQDFVQVFVPKAELVMTKDYDEAVELVIQDQGTRDAGLTAERRADRCGDAARRSASRQSDPELLQPAGGDGDPRRVEGEVVQRRVLAQPAALSRRRLRSAIAVQAGASPTILCSSRTASLRLSIFPLSVKGSSPSVQKKRWRGTL